MKKCFVLFCVSILAAVVLLAQDSMQNNSATNTVALTSQERSQNSLSETIKRIDRKIDELYKKESLTPLNESELLRLDRLQEARMIVELRLKTGAGDMDRAKTLLKEAGEQEETDSVEEQKQIQQTSPQTRDTLLSEIPESLSEKLVSKDDSSAHSAETLSLQETNLDPIEKALDLSEDRLEIYREMMSTSQKRTAEMDEKIAAIQEKIVLLVDDTYPDYSAIYAETHDLTELLYDRAIEQVELRRDLRTILSPEQMKLWMAKSIDAKKTIAKKPVSTQSEGTETMQSLLSEQTLDGDDAGIVYVPMRLVPVQTEEGKKIYRAEPLKTN